MMRQLTSTELKRLHRSWRRENPPRLALILEGLGGPFNLGSILRTAAAYRVEHVWLAGMQIDPSTSNVAKTALGSDRFVPWSATDDFAAAAAEAKSGDFELVGLELAEGATPMHETDFAGPLCLVIGHEDRGLSKTALAACDRAVFLPQLGRIGSLNVATATSIAIWEARRRALSSA